MHHAANIGNETAVELLIEYGFKNPHEALNGQILELNGRSIGGETPLMKASALGHVGICKRLIEV